MTSYTPATLGSLTATCEICGVAQEVQATGTAIKEVDGQMCLVVSMDAIDLQAHMMSHNVCTCQWENQQRQPDALCGIHGA